MVEQITTLNNYNNREKSSMLIINIYIHTTNEKKVCMLNMYTLEYKCINIIMFFVMFSVDVM